MALGGVAVAIRPGIIVPVKPLSGEQIFVLVLRTLGLISDRVLVLVQAVVHVLCTVVLVRDGYETIRQDKVWSGG